MRRLREPAGYIAGLIVASLMAGMLGYHVFAHFSWVDAFVNTAMLLGGMGPVSALETPGAKIFAGVFALYAGLVFLVVAALILSPVFHHVLHRFHWEKGRAES